MVDLAHLAFSRRSKDVNGAKNEKWSLHISEDLRGKKVVRFIWPLFPTLVALFCHTFVFTIFFASFPNNFAPAPDAFRESISSIASACPFIALCAARMKRNPTFDCNRWYLPSGAHSDYNLIYFVGIWNLLLFSNFLRFECFWNSKCYNYKQLKFGTEFSIWSSSDRHKEVNEIRKICFCNYEMMMDALQNTPYRFWIGCVICWAWFFSVWANMGFEAKNRNRTINWPSWSNAFLNYFMHVRHNITLRVCVRVHYLPLEWILQLSGISKLYKALEKEA